MDKPLRASRSRKYLSRENSDWKIRRCLRCSEPFKSWGPGNRRCPRCEEKLKASAARSSRDVPVRVRVN